MIEINEIYLNANFEIASCYMNKSNYEMDMKYLNKTILINANHSDAFNMKGLALTELKEYAKAIECFNKAIEFKSTQADFFKNKGDALKLQGN